MPNQDMIIRFRHKVGASIKRGMSGIQANVRQLSLWSTDRELAACVAAYRQLVKAKAWPAALSAALEIAEMAEARHPLRHRRLLREISQALIPLGAYGRAAEMRIFRRHLFDGRQPNEWMGQDISKRTLLIDFMEDENQGLATAIRYASTIAQAMKRARRTILIVEKRLVPLFQRTFPDVQVFPPGYAEHAANGESLFIPHSPSNPLISLS